LRSSVEPSLACPVAAPAAVCPLEAPLSRRAASCWSEAVLLHPGNKFATTASARAVDTLSLIGVSFHKTSNSQSCYRVVGYTRCNPTARSDKTPAYADVLAK
jgi:hypothetical protein